MPLRVAPITRVARRPCSTGIGSPVSIDSSTCERPSSTTPSTGTFSPGRTRRRSPTCTWSSGDVLLGAVVAQAARGLRRQAQQRLDRGGGLRARAQLQQLAEQGERDDHRGRLEVDADAAVLAERSREQLRRQGGDHAVADTPRPRRCRSASTCSGCGCGSTARSARRTASRPTAPPAWPAPARSRCARRRTARAGAWPNIASSRTATVSGSVHQKRRLKSRSSGFSSSSSAGHLRLQRHAADRAGARAVAGGSPDASGRCTACPGQRLPARIRRSCRMQVLCGIGDETSCGSPPSRSGSRGLRRSGVVRGGCRIDVHAADRIARRSGAIVGASCRWPLQQAVRGGGCAGGMAVRARGDRGVHAALLASAAMIGQPPARRARGRPRPGGAGRRACAPVRPGGASISASLSLAACFMAAMSPSRPSLSASSSRDFLEAEAQRLGAADEVQPGDVVIAVAPVAAGAARGRRQQLLAFVVADGVDGRRR